MQVKLYDGDESNLYIGVAFDAKGRETDVKVKADSLVDAKGRVSASMADYRWVDVQGLSQKKSD